jgi:hypothetical protein
VAVLAAILFLVDPNAQYILSHPWNSFIDFMAEVSVLSRLSLQPIRPRTVPAAAPAASPLCI